MRLIHVLPALSEEASGPSYSVLRLCEALVAQRHDLTLGALDWAPMSIMPPFLKTFPIGMGPARLGRSPKMSKWLVSSCASGRIDVLHNHGMWQMNAVYPAWAATRGRVRLVYSPRGALSEWAMSHGSKSKKVFWPLLQRPALQRASCFHATAESEYEDIRRLGFKQPVAVIANGIDVPRSTPHVMPAERTLLFLGRVHPKKGIDLLLAAWRIVQTEFPQWRLVIAGSDDGYNGSSGYTNELRLLVQKLKAERVEFVGNVYGIEKLRAYRDSAIFVLPTYSENFGMTVAEALAAGTPAIVSKGAPWAGLERESAGWWIDIGVEPLVTCLMAAMAVSPADLVSMGERGRAWMERDFSWTCIGAQMSSTYQWLCDKSLPVPPWVRID